MSGQQVFYRALELLDQPAPIYGRSGEAVRVSSTGP
jgi:hypothetical protein